ncbi:hypothetical protein CLV98_1129 [Dyadobacter jejuensis]|uniref:Filamentation induced by cAMP protein Fic-like C-terminal domain-containing protein n=2 Tax=Dyadobacter jejuensis TaxID=1082580 RepID=A0A316ADS0_9BACT|nr:hypothetical protein [Dyadobacter jejuensis]PWJ55915.1 hypothetical protein CLV98_1129 [Dyadobacter jejuensis]
MSRSELMEAMGLKNRSHFAKNYLEPALSDAIIEITVPDSPRYRNHKCRLTSKGEALKQQLLHDKQ